MGPLLVTIGSRTLRGIDLGGLKPRGLLELLLLARGRSVSKDALADGLWGANPPHNAAGTIEHYVCRLRRQLFDDAHPSRRGILTEPNAYRFDVSGVHVDLDRFDALTARADHAAPALRRELLSDAVALVRGDLLEDEPFATWAQGDREIYRVRTARAHLWLAADALVDRRYAAAVHYGEAALRFAPYSEQAFRTIMVADHAMGHADLARATYVRCRELLDEELSVDLTSDTADLAAAIDAGAPVCELIAPFLHVVRGGGERATSSPIGGDAVVANLSALASSEVTSIGTNLTAPEDGARRRTGTGRVHMRTNVGRLAGSFTRRSNPYASSTALSQAVVAPCDDRAEEAGPWTSLDGM